MYQKIDRGKVKDSDCLSSRSGVKPSSDLYKVSDSLYEVKNRIRNSLSTRSRLLHLRRSYFSRKILQYLPKKRHFRGSWMHRTLGERIFNTKLWGLHRNQVALGLALGIFIALTPTMGIQMPMAALTAFILRVNIPIAVAACWITNPLSAPLIYGLQYKLGILIIGITEPQMLSGVTGVMQNMMRHAKPLWAGSLVAGIVGALISYVTVLVSWRKIEFLWVKRRENNGPSRSMQVKL